MLAKNFLRNGLIALAGAAMKREEVSQFFKQLLEIPFDAKESDLTTRKLNQFQDLSRAYSKTRAERNVSPATEPNAWLALNAVTRYVDHDKSVRGSDDYQGGESEARFASAQFGSGSQMKALAWNLLAPRIKDKVPVLV